MRCLSWGLHRDWLSNLRGLARFGSVARGMSVFRSVTGHADGFVSCVDPLKGYSIVYFYKLNVASVAGLCSNAGLARSPSLAVCRELGHFGTLTPSFRPARRGDHGASRPPWTRPEISRKGAIALLLLKQVIRPDLSGDDTFYGTLI